MPDVSTTTTPAAPPLDRPRQAELLAPAGDFDAMRAAVANGADAVYFGLSAFNARHRAANFPLEKLAETMDFLHARNVRGYVTLNTLIFSDELDEVAALVSACARAKVDALIVQDLGLASLIARLAPRLSVHGSTQMTLTEPRGVEFVKTLGVRRVILARELSADEVGRIASATAMPLEVFVHGALCVAYSGQCLTSEALGGRSANRGQCAQACRLPYDLIVDGAQRDLGEKAYLLSPQDLAAYDLIDDLVKLGVCSFKIEGRLKSPHYVAATTSTYRNALDAALVGQKFSIGAEQYRDLAQSFSRGFTHGFLDGVNHQQLVHARFPKSRGIRAGKVTGKTAAGLLIQLENSGVQLKPGDGVVFDEGHPEQDEQGGRIAEVLPRGKAKVEVRFYGGDVNLSAVAPASIVWKTDDPAVRKRLEHSFSRDTVARRVRLEARVKAVVGEPLSIELRDEEGHRATVKSSEKLDRAHKHPLTIELLRDQLGRLGNTPYELGEVTLDGVDAMAPKSLLNDLRRRGVDELLRQRSGTTVEIHDDALSVMREEARSTGQAMEAPQHSARMTVLARSIDQLRAVLDWRPSTGDRPLMVYCDFEDVRRYKDAVPLARSAGMSIALATLRVMKPGEEGLLRLIAEALPDGVLVRNLGSLSYYRQAHPDLELYGDYSLNISNELTAAIMARSGLGRMVPSYDLNWRQMAALFSRFSPRAFEVVIHQHMPMFHMEHCVFAHVMSSGKDYRDCGRPCEKHHVDLRDRVGQSHPLVPDTGCRNTVYNAAAQSAAEYVPRMKELGIGLFRVELLREDTRAATALLDRYANVLAGREDATTTWRQLRVLNQLGVTRGTLDHV